MPAPKVADVDAFFAKLGPAQRPHLEALRALSLVEAKRGGLVEALKWNFPAYAPASGPGMAWTIQCFKNHCSLRFPVRFFADHRAEAEAAGYEAIEGALKLTWDQALPKALITKLLRARVRDVEAGNLAWSEPTNGALAPRKAARAANAVGATKTRTPARATQPTETPKMKRPSVRAAPKR